MNESVPWAGAQSGGDFQRALADRAKCILQRLHHEWHGIHRRTDHQAREAEHHAAQAQRLGSLAEPAVRPEGDQQVKADHRGWQYQRQSHHRTHRPA
ncbi:hypothetical protein D3C80_1968510 [compost metagenome]